MNGGYWQAFGLKKLAWVACHPLSRRAPLQNARMGYRALSRGVRARSERKNPFCSDTP
jgi:hypothetical protein